MALVVGGIIAERQLASVTSTRQIGIRHAVGARSRDIMVQFLVESVVLSLIGGAIGIVFGAVGASLISRFAAWRTLIDPSAVIIAVGFAGGVGMLFGAYPALLATRLDPVEALGR